MDYSAIKVPHNPDKLSCACVVHVTNTFQADNFLFSCLPDYVDRGLRVRRARDVQKKLIYLSARNTEPIRVVLRLLRQKGFIKRIEYNKHVKID